MMMANNDNKIIKEIKTKFTKIYDIKYHSDSDNKEYLYISGQYLKESIFIGIYYDFRVIAFDIQNNYNEKFIIDIDDYENCNSSLLLFNISSEFKLIVSFVC